MKKGDVNRLHELFIFWWRGWDLKHSGRQDITPEEMITFRQKYVHDS
jgi:hypothetical protein